MMISKQLTDAIVAQIGREFGAHFQYLSIGAYFEALALNGMAKFFYKQAQEEHDHAMKFFKYVMDAGGEMKLPAIEAPKSSFKTAEEAVGLALAWEQDVTRQIFGLKDIAVAEKDYIAQQFLDWFTNEQLEEVSTMDRMLRVVKMAGQSNLFMLEAYISHGGGE